METNTTALEQINDLWRVAEYMQDDELTQALEFIAKVILKPDIPQSVAVVEMVRLQAIAAKMAFNASWYTNISKSEREKKNLCYTAAAELDKLVATLKYFVKS